MSKIPVLLDQVYTRDQVCTNNTLFKIPRRTFIQKSLIYQVINKHSSVKTQPILFMNICYIIRRKLIIILTTNNNDILRSVKCMIVLSQKIKMSSDIATGKQVV